MALSCRALVGLESLEHFKVTEKGNYFLAQQHHLDYKPGYKLVDIATCHSSYHYNDKLLQAIHYPIIILLYLSQERLYCLPTAYLTLGISYANKLLQMYSKVHVERLEECRAVIKYTNKLASPIILDNIIYCVSENGDILKLNGKGQTEVVFTILGQPSSLAFKETEQTFLIADLAHQSIFQRTQTAEPQVHNLINELNNHAFLGPHSLKIGPFTKNIYFTDSGAFQESSIESKLGSVFVIRSENQKLKSLCFRNLAYPSGLEVDEQEKILLVCELGQNRILKFILDENLSGNYTVFHQFHGRVGPSAICGYNSLFYVSLFEFNDISQKGLLAVLNINGEMIEKLFIETGAEITGLHLYQDDDEKEEQVIIVSEENFIYRIPLRKGEEESKMEESIMLSKH